VKQSSSSTVHQGLIARRGLTREGGVNSRFRLTTCFRTQIILSLRARAHCQYWFLFVKLVTLIYLVCYSHLIFIHNRVLLPPSSARVVWPVRKIKFYQFLASYCLVFSVASNILGRKERGMTPFLVTWTPPPLFFDSFQTARGYKLGEYNSSTRTVFKRRLLPSQFTNFRRSCNNFHSLSRARVTLCEALVKK
jgi:hypothetical protein